MSKKLPKENLKKISGGAAAGSKNAELSSSKGGKKNALDTDINITDKASAKKGGIKNVTATTCL